MVVSYRYMPMDLIGWLVMRPPILQLGLDLLFLWVPLFLAEKPFIAFSGIPGRSISRFHSFGFYLLPATFTLWAFSPFFPQGKVQPLDSLANPMPGPVYGMDEREKDEKW
jgi:hypothetical protein